ncbi:MAG: uroporphyrinogen decarboxylase family protein [Candidatus Bathyarchaeia archaeon]
MARSPSRERMVSALELEEADAVPVGDIGVDPPVARVFLGREPVYRNPRASLELVAEGKFDELEERTVKDQVELLHKILRFDFVRVILPGFARGTRVRKAGEDLWEVNGTLYRLHPVAGGLWLTERPQPTLELLRQEIDAAEKALEAVSSEPLGALTRITKQVGDGGLILCNIDAQWISYDAARLVWFYRYPAEMRRLMAAKAKWAAAMAEAMLDAGADGLLDPQDYANKTGPFISLAQFEEFVASNLKAVVDAAHRKGGYYVQHTDGNVKRLIPLLLKCGLDGLNPLDTTSGMNLAEIKAEYGDRICLFGNVDGVHILPRGGRAEVAAETKRCLREGSPGGGYVLTSSHSIHHGVKPENLLAMLETSFKLGEYPKPGRTG